MTGMRRILFVDQSAEMGGAELSLLDIARHYRTTSLVCLFQSGEFERRLATAGVNVITMPLSPAAAAIKKANRNAGLLRAAVGIAGSTLRLSLLSRKFDLVYANTQKALVVSALACLLSRRKLVWHLRDVLTSEHFSKELRRLVVRLANASCDRIICNSHATKAAFVAAGGHSKSCVIHNGIDADAFDREAGEARDSAEISDPRLKIGLFGRLAEWKGQHVAISALAKVPGTCLFIVGGALFGENDYEARLHRQVADLNLNDRVFFMGSRSDVPSLMGKMDVIIHTSISAEPFGRVIVEGMLAERPVVATRAGGAIEIIEDHVSGLLVVPNDVDSLAGALHHLKDSPADRSRLGKAGRTRALSTFSIETMLSKIDTVVRDLVPQQQ